jgi:hypothetical protein
MSRVPLLALNSSSAASYFSNHGQISEGLYASIFSSEVEQNLPHRVLAEIK